MTGEQTGERPKNSLQISDLRAVSKTVSGGFVRRGFKSLPLRLEAMTGPFPRSLEQAFIPEKIRGSLIRALWGPGWTRLPPACRRPRA
jgi:hypothetical protein